MLARLFSQPANVLVLDEPTNDLDAETLELLEDVLGNYQGTVLLVSHDRAFLNNVVTSTLVFEGDGVVREYDGGYDDWLRQRKPETVEVEPSKSSPQRKPAADDTPSPRKLSYKEQRELEALPKQIEELEQQIAEIHDRMAAPEFFKQPGDEIAAVHANLKTLETELADCYERWEALETDV
jgi:ATP-binding cassette subfamily F protein uup